jgi:D-3-phosphoglycerate dehydrogenase / 2-oxoglutarate reductase
MSSQRKILITPTNYSERCIEAKNLLIKKGYQLIENKSDKPFFSFERLKEIMPEIDGVVAGLDDWNESIYKIAKRLKIIARFGIGVDNIDLVKAKKYGIKITNAKGKNANAVAELTISFMLGVLRNVTALNTSVKSGLWERFIGYELAGKNIGLVGFGAISQSVAKKLACFGVNIFAYDKYPNHDIAIELNVKMVSFGEILKNCDIVSLHVPSTEETFHMMGKEQFNMMKDGAYFINTARGALVDEKALYNALTTQKLTTAAIDVYENEPTILENPLLKLNNLICTPHTAAETYEAYNALGNTTAQALIDVFEGKIPENLLNP